MPESVNQRKPTVSKAVTPGSNPGSGAISYEEEEVLNERERARIGWNDTKDYCQALTQEESGDQVRRYQESVVDEWDSLLNGVCC